MRYFKINEALEVVAVSEKYPAECAAVANDASKAFAVWARKIDGTWGAGWINRNDISQYKGGAMMLAEQIAASATKLTGKAYIATDAGEYVSPRYDVIEAPAVGDDCSKGFNGDYYPVGKITKISKGYKQITVEGPRGVLKFFRRKLTGAWTQTGGTWSLVPGVRDEMNPEF